MIAERHNQAHHNHQRNQAGNAGDLKSGAHSSHALTAVEPPAVQPKENLYYMNHADGWMGGLAGGGMWDWTVVGVPVVVLPVVVISRLPKK